MARPGLADRDDLLRWAATVPARTEFPRLIRRLVLETVPDTVRLGFPAGSGVSAGGWDGSVRTITGTPLSRPACRYGSYRSRKV